MASTLSLESEETSASEGQQTSSQNEQEVCKVELEGIDDAKPETVVVGLAFGRGGDAKKPRSGRELRGDHRLQVKIDETTESGDSGPRNQSEGKDSSKQEGSSNFEGKVAVTRSSSRRRFGVQPVTPRLEEPRSVRPNRGMKRRFPGEESDDNNSARKRTRLRSVSRVCTANGQPQSTSETLGKGKPSNLKDWAQRMRGKRRDRQSEVFVCNVEGCEKSFTDAVALYNHGRVHGDRPYVCHYEGCTKRFSERSKLKRHFLIHTGEKPFVCDYEGCGKAFSLDFNLRSHMKTHTGEYHECPHAGCEKRYCQEYKLRAHICKEHKGTGKSRESGGVLSKEDSVISSNDKASKKKVKAEQLQLQRGKLEKSIDGRKKRMQELELELEGQSKELTKIEKALRKVAREQEQVELESCLEQDLSSDNAGEAELGEVYGEEREVVMFAHKHPTADQGARLMDQVMLNQGATPPLSPSISSSQQPFLISRMQLGASSPSFNGPVHFLPYGICPTAMDNCFFTKQDKERQNIGLPLSSQGFSMLHDSRPSDPQVNGVSQANCHNPQTLSLLHEQNSQCEPPVSQLFTYQEQPCLQD